MAQRIVIRELVTLLGYQLQDDQIRKADIVVDRFRDKLEGLNRVAKGVGKGLTLGLTLPIGGLFGAAIKAASDAEEIASKFDAVFKGGADAAREWARETAQATQRSSVDIEEWLATLQDTFVPLGFGREKAAELSKELAQLGIDLASFNNDDPSETVNLLSSALVGNHEAVRRYGIAITQASVDQELLRLGFKKSTQGATDQQKAQARLNLILRGSSDAQGDAVRTAGSFANRLRGLASGVFDLAVGFGKILLPVATKVVLTTTGMVRVVGRLSDGWKRFLIVVGAALASLGPLLLAILATAKALFLLRLGLLALQASAWVRGIIAGTAAAKGLAGALALGAKAAFALFTRFILIPGLILAGAAALVLFAEDLWTMLKGGKSVIGELFEAFLEAPIDPEDHWINQLIWLALSSLKLLISAGDSLGGVVFTVVDNAKKAFNALATFLNETLDAVLSKVTEVVDLIPGSQLVTAGIPSGSATVPASAVNAFARRSSVVEGDSVNVVMQFAPGAQPDAATVSQIREAGREVGEQLSERQKALRDLGGRLR